jgi:hypothetical protein
MTLLLVDHMKLLLLLVDRRMMLLLIDRKYTCLRCYNKCVWELRSDTRLGVVA